MKLGGKKLFTDKSKLYRMVNLRITGWAQSSLAVLFSCDRSSLIAQCDKYGIKPWEDTYSVERIVTDAIPKKTSVWKMKDGEMINMGRDYKDYFKK